MSVTEAKLYDWESAESDDGHVDVTVTWLCITNNIANGPETVRLSALLPTAGTAYLIGSESTAFFYARRPKKCKRVSSQAQDKRRWFVNQVFSTRPLTRFDVTGPIADPLLEPAQITGSALKFMRRFTQDVNGNALLMSNGERMTGSEIEDDDNHLSISIEQNVATVNLLTLTTVLKLTPWNNATLWGLPAHVVRFADFSVRDLYKGDGTRYYRQSLKFDLGGDFVKKILDEGYMEYIGGASGSRSNPKHYARVKDGRGENAAKLPLDGNGNVLANLNTPYFHSKQLKGDSNLLLLGIPSSI